MSSREILHFVAGDAESMTAARQLFLEYLAFLTADAGPVALAVLERFDDELRTLPGPYAPPGGFILLATVNGDAAGCVALRPFDPPTIAEMKRLYVRAPYRSDGIGKMLVERLVTEARMLGYERVRLDTLPSMRAAERLYLSLGFRDIAPYGDNRTPGTRYMERALE